MNFNTLVVAIQKELNDYSTRTKTNVEKWVNAEHKMLCQMRSWNFLVVRKSDDMTFGSADMPINIETDIEVSSSAVAAQSILAIWDITDDVFFEVSQTTQEVLRKTFTMDDATATPPIAWYFISNNEIEFFPPLSDDRVFRFSFKKQIPTYASDSTDALLIPDVYIDVLQERVLYKAFRYKSDDRAKDCKESYFELLSAMIKSENSKIGIINSEVRSNTSRFPMLADDS